MTGIVEGTRDVEQPPGGFLGLDRFDPVPISQATNRVPIRENIPATVVDGTVSLLSCLDAMARDTGFDVDGAVLLERAEEAVFETVHGEMFEREAASVFAKGVSAHVGGFDYPAIDCACKLVSCILPDIRVSPLAIRPDDRTCANISTMVDRVSSFLDVMGPARRICFRLNGGYGRNIDRGFGMFLTDNCLWDVVSSHDPLPQDARLRLLVRYGMCTRAADPALKSIPNIGVFNPRLHCAYMMPVRDIPPESLTFISECVIGNGTTRTRRLI